MYITRKMDYSLRMMLTLACQPQTRLTSEELAEATQVPRQFTLKLSQALTKAGLIKAQRGVGGGIQLARDPQTITIHDILGIADTPRALNECLINPAACTRAGYCAAHHTLHGIQATLDRELKRTTLADLVREQQAIDSRRA